MSTVFLNCFPLYCLTRQLAQNSLYFCLPYTGIMGKTPDCPTSPPFWDRVSLHNTVGLKLKDPSASTSLVLGLEACTTIPGNYPASLWVLGIQTLIHMLVASQSWMFSLFCFVFCFTKRSHYVVQSCLQLAMNFVLTFKSKQFSFLCFPSAGTKMRPNFKESPMKLRSLMSSSLLKISIKSYI